jgi:two-component system, NarL family, sensor kinase
VQAQEDERAGLALTLHDNITQLLCAIQVRTHTLLDKLPPSGAPARREATKLRDMVGNAAAEVESISRNLRPGVLKELGLVAVLRDTTKEFRRADGRIRQTYLRGVARATARRNRVDALPHSPGSLEERGAARQARHVTVQLTKPDAAVQLVIHDDGIGFDPEDHPTRRKGKGGLGLLSMRERAIAAGGVLQVKSVRRAGLAPAGTEIEVRIPLRPGRRGG